MEIKNDSATTSCLFLSLINRFGRKKSLVYMLILAALASTGTVLLTMYDPGQDKGRLARKADSPMI